MTFEIDFLPASYRAAQEASVGRRWSGLMVLLVVGGILVTEGVLRSRLHLLKAMERQTRDQAEAMAMRSSQADQLQRRHQESLEELARWIEPLKAKRASAVLDDILYSCPPSMTLQSVAWKHGGLLDKSATPSLRIVGGIQELKALSKFMLELERTGNTPPLEVSRSGMSSESEEQNLNNFVLNSVVARETVR